MKNKKCIISCGKCYKKYCYLLLGTVSIFFIILILTELLKVYSYKKNLDINNTFNIMSYLFFVSLGEYFMIIPDLILKKSISSKNNTQLAKKLEKYTIEFIFNDNSPEFSSKESIIFICAGILKLFLDIVYIIYKLYLEKYNYIDYILLLLYNLS